MLFGRAAVHTNTGHIVQNTNHPHDGVHSGLSTGHLTGAGSIVRKPPSANLPYGLEHSVLTMVQKLLEGALFDFAKKWAPHFLHEILGFTAPEQGELSAWAPALQRYKGDLLYAFKNMNNTKSADGFLAILTRLHELRHVAVHRLVVGTHGLRRFLPDALEVTGAILQDVPRHQKLRAIEWALWRPQEIDLQEVLSKPEEEFAKLSLPQRDNFVRFAEITGPWSCPGTRRGPMPFGQPCPSAFQGGPIEPKPKRKRGRSPTPEPKRRPRVKRLKAPGEVVDLTNDDEKEHATLAGSRDVIDLTED
ncbi:hypothetical protein BDZ45DRAFT_156035 [Acephala macrosclerotiorum]|nr:hypothetical protein BDZ45DRAFT_156035 [Acephala macrosclerotiorum]